MSNTRVIGIDFGTSTSVIRIKRYDDKNDPLIDKLTTQSVVFNMGSTMVPTLIRKHDGGAYYGYDAVNDKFTHIKKSIFLKIKFGYEYE